jgi:TrfA protein
MDGIGNALNGIKEWMEASKELARKCEEKYYESGFTQLPLWPEEKRGSPNSFLRSALFAAIQSKDRKMLKGAILGSQQGITVKYTGEQLNQEDLTIWLGVVDLVKQHPLETECSFSTHDILKHIGMDNGVKSHQKLRESILRMTACVLIITDEKMTSSNRMIDRFVTDEETEQYKVKLGRYAIKLFGDNERTALEERQRRLLVKKPPASFLNGCYRVQGKLRKSFGKSRSTW